MDVEFKLIGNLTLRQFAYVAVGMGLAYITFTAPLASIIRLPLAVFLGAAGVFFAFYPIDDRSLDIWFINYFRAIYKPQRRLWTKQGHLPDFYYLDLKTHQQQKKNETKEADTRLLTYLSTKKTGLPQTIADLSEEKMLHQINSLIISETGTPTTTHPIPPATTLTSIAYKKVEAEPQTLASKINYATTAIPIQTTRQGTIFRNPITQAKPPDPVILKQQLKANKPTPPTTTLPNLKPAKPEDAHIANQRNEQILTEVKQIINSLKEYNTAGGTPIINPQKFPEVAQAITKQPKQVSVKKLTQTKPARPPATSNLAELKVPTPPITPPTPTEINNQQMATLQAQNQQIITQLQQTKKTLAQITNTPTELLTKPPTPDQPINKPAPQATTPITPSPPNLIEQRQADLEKQLLTEKEQLATPPAKNTTTIHPQEIPPLTNKPNVINGVVYNAKGELVSDAIILIRDNANVPKWASRTNKAGQFSMTSPVTNGKYRLEVQKPKLTFDIIELEATGKLIAPVKISAH